MEGVAFLVDVPSLLIDSLNGYPPEPKHEEDQPREYGSEEAFCDSYGGYDLTRRHEPTSYKSVRGETHRHSRQEGV